MYEYIILPNPLIRRPADSRLCYLQKKIKIKKIIDCVSLLKLSGTCAPGARISKGCSGYMTPSCLASCQSSSMSDDAKPDRGQLIEILLLLIQRECCLSVPLHLLQLHLFQTSRLTAGSFSFPIPPSRLPPFRNLKGFRDPIRK